MRVRCGVSIEVTLLTALTSSNPCQYRPVLGGCSRHQLQLLHSKI